MANSTKRKRRGSGEGSLVQRPDGRWMARFYVTLPDGTRKRQHITLRDRDEVVRRMREEMASADKGLSINHEKRSVADWLNYWIAEIAPANIKDSTLHTHQRHVANNIIPEIGHISLLNLKPDHVRRMLVNWQKQGVGGRSQQKARNVLSAALRDAMKLEYVHRNVARLVDPPKYPPRERKVWSAEEVQQFLEATKSHRYYGLFLILFHYGLRRGEATGLRWKDVDFDKDVIHVRQQVYYVGHTQAIGELKTPESRRDLVLTPEIKEVLLAERIRRGYPDEGETLYLSNRGNPVEGRTLIQLFKKLATDIGLEPITIHEIRHTFTSLLHSGGVSPKVAQGILGHRSIVTTLQVYTHSTKEERADAVTLITRGYSS